MMRKIPADRHGLRLRAMIVVLWRGGLRIQEALDRDRVRSRRPTRLDSRPGAGRETSGGRSGWTRGRGAITLPHGSRVGLELPLGALFCVIDGPTRGRPWSATAVRGAAPLRARGRCSAQVRATSAQACSRCRARPRRRAPTGDPAPARAFVCLHDQRLPAGDRRRGDHRRDPQPARADDARQRRPRALSQ